MTLWPGRTSQHQCGDRAVTALGKESLHGCGTPTCIIHESGLSGSMCTYMPLKAFRHRVPAAQQQPGGGSGGLTAVAIGVARRRRHTCSTSVLRLTDTLQAGDLRAVVIAGAASTLRTSRRTQSLAVTGNHDTSELSEHAGWRPPRLRGSDDGSPTGLEGVT